MHNFFLIRHFGKSGFAVPLPHLRRSLLEVVEIVVKGSFYKIGNLFKILLIKL